MSSSVCYLCVLDNYPDRLLVDNDISTQHSLRSLLNNYFSHIWPTKENRVLVKCLNIILLLGNFSSYLTFIICVFKRCGTISYLKRVKLLILIYYLNKYSASRNVIIAIYYNILESKNKIFLLEHRRGRQSIDIFCKEKHNTEN